MLGKQLLFGDGLGCVITEEPDVSFCGFAQDTLEGEFKATAVRIVCPRIDGVGIDNEVTDGAVSSRHIPHAARLLVHEYGGVTGGCLG